ncbi:transposase, YhgA-like family protein [Orientia tsutsugamushi str. UT144]|uniref:Transposase, YhgA-like family protein n=1 Tax=Orientia tsutsugamushi str. UT144 TaxID=1441384 RepID=A0A0F3RKV7_ORITS|nr:transposase, YhgA-like family protein [Orientia tsutsugamushi str. UT144]
MDLFTDSMIAKQLMTSDYQLVDLQSMSNDEIVKKAYRYRDKNQSEIIIL